MTKPYDRNDNDTYVEIISLNPAHDAEAHMFRDQNGRTRSHGVMGNFSEETRKKAANKVLSFSNASALGLTTIKSVQLSTPLPMSLANRYKCNVDSLFYSQNVPVFFDSKREKFVLLMDYRLLRDIKADELIPLIKGPSAKYITRYTGKDGSKHLGILYESLDQLRNDNLERKDACGHFSCFKDAYQDYFLTLQKGEKVIVVRFVSSNDKPEFFRTKRDATVSTSVNVSGMHLELAIAFKFGSRCYLSMDGVTFSQNDAMHIDKASFQRGKENLSQDITKYLRAEDPGLLILPFSEDQFRLLKGIHDRLHALNNELHGFLSGFMSEERETDTPITPESLTGMSNALKRLAHDQSDE